jgi:hypothetical protein
MQPRRRHWSSPLGKTAVLTLLAGVLAVPSGGGQAGEKPHASFPKLDRRAEKLPPAFQGVNPEAFYWRLPDDTRNDGEGDDEYRARVERNHAPIAGTYAFPVQLQSGTLTLGPCSWSASYDEAAKRVVVVTTAVHDNRVCLFYKTNVEPFQAGGAPLPPTARERKDKSVQLQIENGRGSAALRSLQSGNEPSLAIADVEPARATQLLEGKGLGIAAVADAVGAGDVDLERIEIGPLTPIELWIRTYLIVVRQPEIWLFDKKTGEILRKLPLQD